MLGKTKNGADRSQPCRFTPIYGAAAASVASLERTCAILRRRRGLVEKGIREIEISHMGPLLDMLSAKTGMSRKELLWMERIRLIKIIAENPELRAVFISESCMMTPTYTRSRRLELTETELFKHLHGTRAPKVLDVGVGGFETDDFAITTFELAAALMSLDATVYGGDILVKEPFRMERKVEVQEEAHVAEVRFIPFDMFRPGSERYDAIRAAHVLNHYDEITAMNLVVGLKGILKDPGVLVTGTNRGYTVSLLRNGSWASYKIYN
ncbi:MAG: hypothetical protein ACP5NX_02990 [Candidatus Bilamarchaeaceae archaeon]